MSDKELLKKISQYAERRERANKDVDYVVPMSDMSEIIAIVREHSEPNVLLTTHIRRLKVERKRERKRCIDAIQADMSMSPIEKQIAIKAIKALEA